MHRTVHSQRSAKQNKKRRFYWALVRIFVAVAATSFYFYFLAIECSSMVQVNRLRNGVLLDVTIIDWLRLNGEEVEMEQYLSRNITLLPPDPYSDSPYAPVVLSYDQLFLIQKESLALLYSLENLAIVNEMLHGNESEQFYAYVQQVEEIHAEWHTRTAFTWERYFDLSAFWHRLRFFLIDIVSRHDISGLQRQQIATYSVALTALLYYVENLESMRDAVLQYYHHPTVAHHDRVIEYGKARAIYEREVYQKLPPALDDVYVASEVLPAWQECDRVVNAYRTTIEDEAFQSTFDPERWYECVLMLLHSHRWIRYRLREILLYELKVYFNEMAGLMVVACMGIVLELIAAGSLLQQALPVVLSYVEKGSTSSKQASSNPKTNTNGVVNAPPKLSHSDL